MKQKIRRPEWIRRIFSFYFADLLHYSCFLECRVCAVLLYVAVALDGHVDKDRLIQLRYEYTALLEVGLAAYFPGWIELRSTRTV